jgi:hypothetical protein
MIQVLFVNPYDLLWSGKKHQLDYKNQRVQRTIRYLTCNSHVIELIRFQIQIDLLGLIVKFKRQEHTKINISSLRNPKIYACTTSF